MTRFKKIIGAASFTLLPFLSSAQYKFEMEYRIKSEAVPEPAQMFIDSIAPLKDLKWYKEVSMDSITIEAKFNHKRKKFSVEFDTLGNLQDAEFVIKEKDISPSILQNITPKLDSIYEKWKFRKIQLNYTGSGSDILQTIEKSQQVGSVKIAYEIVLKGKNKEGTSLYELTFSEEGELLKFLKIKQAKADHLEY